MVAHRADSPRAGRLAPRLRQSTTLSGAGTGGTLAWGRAAFAVLRAGFVLITGRLIHHTGSVVGGTHSPTRPLLRHPSWIWWLLLLAVAGLALLVAHPARGATVSGTIAIPTGDQGYQPGINNTYPSKVRVVGTAIETNVVATTKSTGTFTLTGVPSGAVTLLYVETPGEDSFTMESRRVSLNVTGDVADVQFNLQHHWRFLPSYPPPYSQRADYDIWEPYWVSAKVGFMFFLNRSVEGEAVTAEPLRGKLEELTFWTVSRARN